MDSRYKKKYGYDYGKMIVEQKNKTVAELTNNVFTEWNDYLETMGSICDFYNYMWKFYSDGRLVLCDMNFLERKTVTFEWKKESTCGHLEYRSLFEMLLDWLDELKINESEEQFSEEIPFIEKLWENTYVNKQFSEYSNTDELHKHFSYWSNACGDFWHDGKDLNSESELPCELQRALHHMWKEGYGCYEYLAEYNGKYYVALASEFGNEFAKDEHITMDTLYELAKHNALKLFSQELFKNTILVMGKNTGFEQCHEIMFLVPALEAENVYDEIEAAIYKNIWEIAGIGKNCPQKRTSNTKKYYAITTSMKFEKTVLVPENVVDNIEDAIEIVNDGVEVASIDLLNEEAECETKASCYADSNGIMELSDIAASCYQVLE